MLVTVVCEEPGRAPAGFAERKDSIREAVRADLRGARWPQRLALVGMMCWITYEWGPGNETVTPWLLARVIAGSDGVWVIPVTALVGFCFTVVQQLASGFTALAGFSLFDRTSRAAWNRLRHRSDFALGEWSRLGWGSRSAMVFALGTTSVALIQVMTTGEVGLRRHQRAIVTSAVLCATLVGMIGALAAGLGLIGRNVPAFEAVTAWILRVLGNPLFWIALIIASFGGRRIFAVWPRTNAGLTT